MWNEWATNNKANDTEFQKSPKKEEIISFCMKSWELITADLIKKSFECTGISKELTSESSLFSRLEIHATLHEELEKSIQKHESNVIQPNQKKIEVFLKRKENKKNEKEEKAANTQLSLDSFLNLDKQ